jgi:amino acid adenylation domain-containing protein
LQEGPGGAVFSKSAPPGRRRQCFYHTGDLARWLSNGEIECIGREDHQVKIRGFRIELEEIEAQLVKHKDIKEAVVMPMGDEQSGKYLAAYLVPVPGLKGKAFDVSGPREFLRRHLPDYMIPSYYVRLEEIPLTPNGKVDRRRLPGPGTAGIEESSIYHPPRDPLEKKLVDIWSKVLGIDKSTIGIDDNFFERGGHSLRAIVMTTIIHKEFDVMIPLAEIFKAPSIRGISLCLGNSVQEKYAAIEPAEAKEYYPVSSAQKRLYILHRLDPNSLGYNLPKVFVVEGIPDELRLENTFRRLIERHESLRTGFGMEGGEPVQRIDEVEETDFSIEYYQSAAEIHHLFIRPFDLAKAPLLRVGLIKNDENGHLLLIDMHHIITDGTSEAILAQEFTALYSGQDLLELRLQYKDYAVWQNCPRQHQVLEHQKNYWVELYSDEVPVLQLPADYPRPPIQGFEGSTADFRLSGEEVSELKGLAKETESTLFMCILSLFNILLSRLGSPEDIVVGTPAASRRHADLENIIGIFINTLALRNFPSGHKTFKEFLKEVKKQALEAYENQEYPFEELVEQLVINRDLSRNPLFDAMFILHNEFQPRTGTIPGPAKMDLNLESYDYEKRTSQFDLTLVGFEGENRLVFRIEYSTRLFKEETVRRFIKYFKEIITMVLRDPQVKLAGIEIIPEEEKNQVLYEFNNTGAAYPQDKTLHELFREQVERTPDHVALLCSEGIGGLAPLPAPISIITYRELNEKADQLAYQLKEKGVKPGSIAAIMVDRTIHMIVGLLGILKAGAAYLPLDPEYPGERIRYMLKHSGAAMLVTTRAAPHVGAVRELPLQLINLEDVLSIPTSTSTLTSTCRVSPANPAYVIYTSGSTGNPKGVVIGHQNVVNFITGMAAVIDFLPGQAILALTTISFDIFFLETLLPLTRGLKVVMAGGSHQKDPALLEQLILKSQVNMIQLTPSRLQLLLSLRGNLQGLAGVEVLMVGGEAFPSLLLEKVKEHFQGKIYNMYGPTETTIWSAVKELTHTLPGEITIGSPIANTQVYIVDKNRHLQPLGVTGELLIGGDGVALGYLNNVELTAEKFKINRSYRSYRTYIKLYQTGDLARWLSTGEIEFLGRLDHQVKIRGFRIELEEIEEQLLKLEHIKEAVVVLKTNSSAQEYLCAYMVPHPGDSSNLPDTTVLRERLSVKLPTYMIPAYFLYMDEMPLTPNGKIDREALPEPDRPVLHPGTPGTFVAPATDNEKTIARLWKEILHLEKVGIYENFFDLGGNSMNLVQLNWKLKEILGIDIPVALMFRNLTIDFLSKYLDQEKIKVQNREKQVTALDRAQDTLQDTLSKLIIE